MAKPFRTKSSSPWKGAKKFGDKKPWDRNGGGDRKPWERGGDRDGARPEMHQTVCFQCSKPCSVPFVPTGKRPIFCSTCFQKEGNTQPRTAPRGNDSRRESYGDKPSYKPSFDRTENRAESTNQSANYDHLKVQFAMLNTKLDVIIKALANKAETKEEAEVIITDGSAQEQIEEIKKVTKKTAATKRKKSLEA